VIDLRCGDSVRLLAEDPALRLVDAVVTDPPSGIHFMGQDWDHHKGGRDRWVGWLAGIMAECLRLARPGAHALVWALPRTSHWTAILLAALAEGFDAIGIEQDPQYVEIARRRLASVTPSLALA
jgi:DNA modification methylase